MSGDKEYIIDIVEEIRDYAEHRDFDSDGNVSTTMLRVFADRIEDAWRRERVNVEEMRKTLERLLFVIIGGGLKRDRSYKQFTGKDLAVELIAQIKSALATEKEGGAE